MVGAGRALDADLKAKAAAKYDARLEHDARTWISDVLGSPLGEGSLHKVSAAGIRALWALWALRALWACNDAAVQPTFVFGFVCFRGSRSSGELHTATPDCGRLSFARGTVRTGRTPASPPRVIPQVLGSGEVLCKLLNAVDPAQRCIPPSSSKSPFKMMENISHYLKARRDHRLHTA
jgi:hypothetical protein